MNPEEYAQLFRLSENHWWFVGTRDILFSSIAGKYLPGTRILDVGCGSASMMKRSSQIGPVVGIDTSIGALKHCHSIGFSSLCQGDAAKLPFKSNTFGLVIAADMLEHCDNDERALAELNRVTAHGGTLLISVPAHNALWSAHDIALHHKRRYAKRGLIRKAENAGFIVNRTSSFNTILLAPVALARLTWGKPRRHSSSGYKIKYHENLRLLNRLMLAILRFERWFLGHGNLPFGLSILLLASKK